ncbi:hypothetical protein Q9L58_010430 [Maublancomyces gigas]|uniref:Uncharacterized protein n=1 Tax=Discina gigas TaxID=1032678 RepID=A0ABR3G472_9PEZI
MTTTAFNLPSSPTSPASPISNPPLVLTVILTIGKCNAKRCFCLEGRFAAPSENPATLECENCQHSFTHHTLNPSDSRATALSVPVVHRLPKIPPFWSLRAAVVKNIYDRMIYYRVLHIRGTPASGKSILRLLLSRYIIDNGLNGAVAFIESCLNLPRDQFYSTQDRGLLVDEAQLTYSNVYFWDSFLKLIDDTPGVHVIHFSYYGSPGRRPIELVGVTPPVLHAAQRHQE